MFSLRLDPQPKELARSIEAAVQRGIKAAKHELKEAKQSQPPPASKAHAALRSALGKIDTGERELAAAQTKAVDALIAAL